MILFMANKTELTKLWRKFIDVNLYRIMPINQKRDTLRTGLNPAKDPYEQINPKIKKMFKLIIKLERKGITFVDTWRNGPVKGSTIVKISKRSVDGKYIDFVANKKQLQVYKKRWIGGGCLATFVLKLTDFLIDNQDYLNRSEKKLAKFLNNWANKRKNNKRFTISVRGSNRCFESALFYCYVPEFKEYWKSPFGSFEHFQKVVKREGLRKYLPYFENKKLFYLRVENRINPKDITLIK